MLCIVSNLAGNSECNALRMDEIPVAAFTASIYEISLLKLFDYTGCHKYVPFEPSFEQTKMHLCSD
jgi:hypothetical protein